MDLESDTKVNGNGTTIEVDGTAEKKELLPVTKGRGLKKWRRIHRESSKETSNSFDSNRKRGITVLPVGRNQRSEGSSSSTNAVSNVLGNALDRISLYGDLSSRKGVDSASRADSENSRSSTAASAPRGNHELPVLKPGFNTIGKNSGSLVQVDNLQNKSRDVRKKARGGKIKKENSISSLESDSRSSNSVFLQGANSLTSIGRMNGGSGNYDEDDSDDHVGIGNQDDLDESMLPLHLAQEALQREFENLKDVGKEEISSSEEHQEHEFLTKLKEAKISELESTLNSTELKTEYDELLKQRFAAEVEYIVISRTIQTLKTGRIDLTVEQKNQSATAGSLEEEEDDEKKVKNRVWRYVYCVMIQLILLLVVLHIFVLKFSPKSVEVIPT